MPVTIETLANSRLYNGDAIYFGTDLTTAGAYAKINRHATTARLDVLLPSTGMLILPYQNDGGIIQIGNGTTDMDVKIFLGDTSHYVLFDVGLQRLIIYGCDVALSGDLTVTVEDISIVVGRKFFLDGQDGGEYIWSENAGYMDLEATTAIRINADLQTDRWQDTITNTLIGMGVCGAGALTGSTNSAFGKSALYSITSGTVNTALGVETLYNLTSGTQNTALGYQALVGVTTGHSNLGVGHQAGDNITTGSGNIVIGFRVDAPSTTADYQIVIGDNTNQGRLLGDNAGDMQINALSSKTVELAVAGTAVITAAGTLITFAQPQTYTDTLTSQTTENIGVTLTYTTDSTFISSADITWSGTYTSSVLKIVGTFTNTTGGLHGILVQMIMDQDFTAATEGILAVKSYLDMTNSAITEGNFMAGEFIAKKSGSGTMATGAILYGLEAWTYVTDTSIVGTMLGGNIGYHADTNQDCSTAGNVWRGLQVFCDNLANAAYDAEETTGIYIWPHSGTIKNALCIGTGIGTWTTGIKFVGGGTTTTGIKFGGYASDTGNINVTMTTAIKIDEVTGLVTAIEMLGGIHYHILTVGATANTSGDGILVQAGAAGRPFYIAADDGDAGSAPGETLTVGRVRFLCSAGSGDYYYGEQYTWQATIKYVAGTSISSYSSALIGTFEYTGSIIVSANYHGAVMGRVGGGAININAGAVLAGVFGWANLSADHTGSGLSAAFCAMTTSTTYNWDIGLYIPNDSAVTGVQVGSSGTPFDLATSGQKALAVYTTSARTSGDQMAAYLEYHLAGANCEGQALRARLECDERIGGSAEAIYAIADMNAQTYVVGKLAAVRGMVILSSGDITHGNLSCSEAEMEAPAGVDGLMNINASFIRMMATGDGVAHIQRYAHLMNLVGFGTASSTANLFHTNGGAATTHGLRIVIDEVSYDILLSVSTYA